MAKFNEIIQTVVENIEKVVIGKRPEILTVLSAFLARGHVLLEDVPGVAKTVLARSLAVSLGCDFKRIQCTPDLLPTDISGVSVFNQQSRQFEFLRGPVFTNVLLADEINRATPRTQSALLEAMEESQVSVDGLTHRLSEPFFVVATQNPIEQEGTFPLPEAQLDRFLVRVSMGYPNFHDETEMLARLQKGHPLDTLKPVLDARIAVKMREFIQNIFVHDQVRGYMLRIVHATRSNLKLNLGGSPRASIAFFRSAQAMAAIDGRDFATPDDVKKLAAPVLAHRLILKPEFRLRKESTRAVVEEILENTEVPSSIFSYRDKKSGTELKAFNQWSGSKE